MGDISHVISNIITSPASSTKYIQFSIQFPPPNSPKSSPSPITNSTSPNFLRNIQCFRQQQSPPSTRQNLQTPYPRRTTTSGSKSRSKRCSAPPALSTGSRGKNINMKSPSHSTCSRPRRNSSSVRFPFPPFPLTPLPPFFNLKENKKEKNNKLTSLTPPRPPWFRDAVPRGVGAEGNPPQKITDSFLLLFLSMVLIAALLYLPEHVAKMASRAWFYYTGDEAAAAAAAAAAVAGSSLTAGRGGGGGNVGRGGGNNVEGIPKGPVRTEAIAMLRRDVDSVGRGDVDVERKRRGEEVLELLGRL